MHTRLLLFAALAAWIPAAAAFTQPDHGLFARARHHAKITLRGFAARQKGRVVNQRKVCYDMVGCFQSTRRHSALRRFPEAPHTINTKFLLFTRDNPTKAQIIDYGDNLKSINSSNFNHERLLKVMIHGYKGSGTDEGAKIGIAQFLNLMDINLVFVDWTKGAAGPSYPTSVANTELVGRQLALVLIDMISIGYKAQNIHIIGFSLGAHVAACASYILQTKGIKVARITGLDPASPIYKSNRLLEASRKLDKSDADFVDVIHTDGSRWWTNGFGLLQPLGHVDFFPNGGREQPGCNDGRASLVVSHFEGTANTSTVCSHVRAWRLFLESAAQARRGPEGCRFVAFPCPPGPARARFPDGGCFPAAGSCDGACGEMGIGARDAPARGPLFLVTRDASPFCGHQLRATILISERTPRTRGILLMTLKSNGSATNFQMHYEFPDIIQGGRVMWGLAAAKFGSINVQTFNMSAVLSYQSLAYQKESSDNDNDHNDQYYPNAQVFLDKVSVQDLSGTSWHFCEKETQLKKDSTSSFNELAITLTLNPCVL